MILMLNWLLFEWKIIFGQKSSKTDTVKGWNCWIGSDNLENLANMRIPSEINTTLLILKASILKIYGQQQKKNTTSEILWLHCNLYWNDWQSDMKEEGPPFSILYALVYHFESNLNSFLANVAWPSKSSLTLMELS